MSPMTFHIDQITEKMKILLSAGLDMVFFLLKQNKKMLTNVGMSQTTFRIDQTREKIKMLLGLEWHVFFISS